MMLETPMIYTSFFFQGGPYHNANRMADYTIHELFREGLRTAFYSIKNRGLCISHKPP